MNSLQKNTSNILLTRFPLESAWGGEEKIHLLMAKIFRKHGIETFLLSSCPHLKSAFQKDGFPVFSDIQKDITSKRQLLWSLIGISSVPLLFVRGLFALIYFRFFRNVRTVLFLTFVEKIAWTPIARMLGIKVFWGHHAPLGSWFFQNPYLPFWKLWSKLNVQIIVPSESMKAELNSVLRKPHAIKVLSNTISYENTNIDHSCKEFEEIVNSKSGIGIIKEKYFTVGTANRLSREKGMFEVLEAARMLQDTYPEIIFLCAGKGPEEEKLREYVTQNKIQNIVFLGFLYERELQVFYAGIDLFLLASQSEPFGIALLEAMSQRKPIVASAVGGIPEVLGEENEGLVPAQNPERIAEKIAEFFENGQKRQVVGEENLRRFQNYFSPSIFENKLLDTFIDQR